METHAADEPDAGARANECLPVALAHTHTHTHERTHARTHTHLPFTKEHNPRARLVVLRR